jgi:fido (protein-threonine AMPylation protein)
LDECVNFLEHLAVMLMNEVDHDADESDKYKILRYRRPATYLPSSAPSNLVALQMRWAKLQERHDGAEQFARYACVDTSELEGVFCLTGDSKLKLARCGFYTNSIEGISQNSRIRQRSKVLQILENTQRCFNHVLGSDLHAPIFTEDFVKELHQLLLDGNNIEHELDGGIYAATIIPMGQYRGVPCFSTHESSSDERIYETRYCPPADIERDMNWFIEQIQPMLSQAEGDKDPFRVCAWIQWAFVRIYPFVEGNGRVSRVLSSVPLVRCGLPPVYVSASSKPEYLQALIDADTEGDIDGLARFLQDEAFIALERLLDYNHDNMGTLDLMATSVSSDISTSRR